VTWPRLPGEFLMIHTVTDFWDSDKGFRLSRESKSLSLALALFARRALARAHDLMMTPHRLGHCHCASGHRDSGCQPKAAASEAQAPGVIDTDTPTAVPRVRGRLPGRGRRNRYGHRAWARLRRPHFHRVTPWVTAAAVTVAVTACRSASE
jgi:hypothetical protein